MSDGSPECLPGWKQANKWARDADGRKAAVLSALVMFGASYLDLTPRRAPPSPEMMAAREAATKVAERQAIAAERIAAAIERQARALERLARAKQP